MLAGSSGTVLSHHAAAAWYDFRGYRKGQVDVLSHRWHRARPPWLVVHESSRLEPIDVATIRGIPTTTRVRTFIDLAAVSYPDRIGRALDEERRRGTLHLDELARRLEQLAASGRKGVRVLRALIEEREGRLLTTTGFEELFMEVVRSYRLPEPEHQWKVVDGSFTAYLDFAYPEHLLAIEADSEEYHLDLEAFHHDRTRHNRLTTLGWTLLRYTGRHLRDHRLTVATQLARALDRPLLPTGSAR